MDTILVSFVVLSFTGLLLYLIYEDKLEKATYLAIIMAGVLFFAAVAYGDTNWRLVVVSWYGEIPAEATEVTFAYQSDCEAAYERLVRSFEAESDPLFGFVIMECERADIVVPAESGAGSVPVQSNGS